MKKILITGGAGFVGRHFCRRFLEQGYIVVCVDSMVEGTGAENPWLITGSKKSGWRLFDPFEYNKECGGYRFDIRRQDCRRFFNKNEESFDYAFHLAAIVGGRQMIENNPIAVADDLSIDAAFWQWAVKAKPKKVVCFSSSAAYPVDLQTERYHRLLKEDDINLEDPALGAPDMSYGWAKLTCEYLAKLAYKHHGINSVVYRPFSGYGEDQDMAYPVPAICKRVIEHDNQKSLGRFRIWGSGRQSRDFIHIDDVVDGVITTMDKVDDSSAINLSTGIGTNFTALAHAAGAILGKQFYIETEPNTPEGVFSRIGDTGLQKSLGFKPEILLHEGLERVIRFLNHDA